MGGVNGGFLNQLNSLKRRLSIGMNPDNPERGSADWYRRRLIRSLAVYLGRWHFCLLEADFPITYKQRQILFEKGAKGFVDMLSDEEVKELFEAIDIYQVDKRVGI